MSDADRIGAAYDAVAPDYDRQLEPAAWIRRILWRHFDRLFRAGDRVLDVGCGTGSDAFHLARNGVRVTAVDVSAEMLARLRPKLERASPTLDVDVKLGDIDEVAPSLAGPFDGIISSFAALNTVDLSSFARHAARLLRPGGRLICHMLAAARHAPSRPDTSDHRTITVGGQALPHLSLDPDDVYDRFFASQFSLRGRHALGFLVGTRGETWLPQSMLDLAGRLESIVGAAHFLATRGRFFLLDLQRR